MSGRPRRELLAGAVILLFGLVALKEGLRLGVGSLSQMGPGFIPLVLGVLLCGLSLPIALSRDEDDWVEPIPERLDWRGASFIVGGAMAFLVLGRFAGLLPASFACVFIAAMGDRVTTLRAATILSAGISAFGCVLFSIVLKIPIPLIAGLHL
jgi:putative tricarboxylic transport membrane protein